MFKTEATVLMQKLLELLKSIEIEIRAFGNLSKEILLEMTKLSEWEFRIVEGFITEVNLAKQKNITNLILKIQLKTILSWIY
jgi:hypothetical protein